MISHIGLKPVIWIGSSHHDWLSFPEKVQDVMGYSLYLAQHGENSKSTKSLKGFRNFKGTTVMEIVTDFNTDAYRAVYTTKFKEAIYVLHAFQKKSKKGISTPINEIRLIEQRLKTAKGYHERHQQ